MNERATGNGQTHSAKPSDVTRALQRWNDGNPDALDKLISAVFEKLCRIAKNLTQSERSEHALQPAELVNELYIRLRGQRKVEWKSSRQFFAFASQLMRMILVDHARRRQTEKRGKGISRIPLEELTEVAEHADTDLLRLNEALQELARIDPRQRQIVELRFFTGLSIEEIGKVIGFSRATIIREWRTARLWIQHQLEEG